MVDFEMGADTRLLAGEVKKFLDANRESATEFYTACNIHAESVQSLFKECGGSDGK